jgi:hypothetical protein
MQLGQDWDAASDDRSQPHADGRGRHERDGAAWGDERQVAVWGQVSARTLYAVVMLDLVAGTVFDLLDSSRYMPCVLVFFAIALGATAYSGWTAGRKGVDVRASHTTDRAQLVVSSLVSSVILYAIIRFMAEGHNRHSWLAAAMAVGFGALTWLTENGQRVPRAKGWAELRAKGRGKLAGWFVGLMVTSLVSGAVYYGIAWSLADSVGHESWPSALGTIAGITIGWGFATWFIAAWGRRWALRLPGATTDDARDAPGPSSQSTLPSGAMLSSVQERILRDAVELAE